MDGTVLRYRAGTDELMEREHELRAALFGIETAAAALDEQRDRMRSTDIDQLVQAIASEARRLQAMLTADDERQSVFDIAEAIGPAIVMAGAMGVVVRDAIPNGTWVQGCRDRTAQVVFCLLDNARVHAGGSTVDLRVASGQGITTLYVEDRGPGLSPACRRRMFERGLRGAESRGTGLGLFIALRLMLEQGGSLTAAPRPGGGSSFALGLPASASPSTPQPGGAHRQWATVR